MQNVGQEDASAGSKSWDNYILWARINLLQGTVLTKMRQRDEGGYVLFFTDTGLVLSKGLPGRDDILTNNWESYSLNRWYELRVEVQGSTIKVYVNGILRIDYTDPEPLLNGTIAFGGGENTTFYVDNVLVTTGK
jgi:hypothetical protein